ncbi:uncharacterized protein LOC123292693 [Chrysoperla carnea]|uniref:uncharacterized protein LOC123292693 n=1 Tax=Chrysoperla carnea TaxID=189513 RepID=UPI001D0989B3|nr:uncharacterized protein LOC123292693 [Chrysoperla carnea]
MYKNEYLIDIPITCKNTASGEKRRACLKRICPTLEGKEYNRDFGLGSCQPHCAPNGVYFPGKCPYKSIPACICKKGYCRNPLNWYKCIQPRVYKKTTEQQTKCVDKNNPENNNSGKECIENNISESKITSSESSMDTGKSSEELIPPNLGSLDLLNPTDAKSNESVDKNTSETKDTDESGIEQEGNKPNKSVDKNVGKTNDPNGSGINEEENHPDASASSNASAGETMANDDTEEFEGSLLKIPKFGEHSHSEEDLVDFAINLVRRT